MSRHDAKQELERQLTDGMPAPSPAPARLHLGTIKEAPEVFQFRNPYPHASRAHINELAKAMRERRPLAAIRVWWGGFAWYCVDGHHRLAAYRKGMWPHQEPIPVDVFAGTIEQAMLIALGGNAPDKLPMSKAEKTNAAWELVVTTQASKAHLARRACVSERTIAYMRKAAQSLLLKDPARDLTAITWWKARQEAAGEGAQELPDYDEATVKEAGEMANKLSRAFGKRASERPEAFALALEIYDKRFPATLPDAWRSAGHLIEDEDEENPDF